MRKLEILLGDAKFIVSDNANTPDSTRAWVNAPHSHVDNEIHIVTQGNATMQVGNEQFFICEGDVCFVPQKLYHYHSSYSDNFDKQTFFFSLIKNNEHTKEKNFSEYSFYNDIFNLHKKFSVIKNTNLPLIAKELFNMQASDKNEHLYQVLYASFIVFLSKLMPIESVDNRELLQKNHNDASDYEQKNITEEFFQNQYNQNVTIEDLAEKLYKSVPQTHRIVKHYYNMSFRQVLIKQRMEHACMLINQGSSNFIQIAISCGYNTYNGFLTAFKKYIGKTPEEYKNYTKK